MFDLFSPFGMFSNFICFEADGKTGGASGTVAKTGEESTDDDTDEDEETDEDELTEPGAEATVEDWKAYSAKLAEKNKTTTVDPAVIQAAKDEAIADLKKQQDKEARAERAKTARKAGDTATQINLLTEENNTLKTENEKLKSDNATNALNLMKQQVGAEFKLPAKLVNRLQGTTLAELKADAKDLAKDIPTGASRTDLEGGNRNNTTKEDQTKAATRAARSLVTLF